LVPVIAFLAKEAVAAAASHYTGGATDFLSVGRSARNVGKYLGSKFAIKNRVGKSVGAAATEQFTVRRFVSKKQLKELKKMELNLILLLEMAYLLRHEILIQRIRHKLGDVQVLIPHRFKLILTQQQFPVVQKV